jgi:hypothetical protein
MNEVIAKEKVVDKLEREKLRDLEKMKIFHNKSKLQKSEHEPPRAPVRRMSVVNMLSMPSFRNPSPASEKANKISKQKSFMRRLFTTGKSKIGAAFISENHFWISNFA